MSIDTKKLLHNIGDEIKEILYEYVKRQSFTYSAGEKEAEAFFLDYFSSLPYFKENPDYFGAYAIEGDTFDRAPTFAMVKGEGNDTIVMIHHYDVVTVEDFKLLKSLAFSPDNLYEELLKMKDTFTGDTLNDLVSGEWLYGRGVCDMKGGGAIQMALLNRYSQLENFKGNLIVLGVPDEENLSAGMRAGVLLLDELRVKYGLKYRLMINSEPHQRKNPNEGIFSLGSVGKLMPFVYVRGSLAHAGKVFEGFNPVNLMSSIVRKTEVNMTLSDVIDGEAAPPPTWLYLKDGKVIYDVSMPLTVNGCLSVLTLNQTPSSMMEKIKDICTSAFDEIIVDMNQNYEKFLRHTNQPIQTLPWKTNVVDFETLWQEAFDNKGEVFAKAYREEIEALKRKMKNNELSLIQCNFALVDFVYDYISDLSPRIVYGLIPPYYPNTANILWENLPADVASLADTLIEDTKGTYGQTYTKEHFYTGISDLSYCGIFQSKEIDKTLRASMPMFQEMYDLPLETVEKIAMPCINVGPWGKDFHKLTERVLKEDLYVRTPHILQRTISLILGE